MLIVGIAAITLIMTLILLLAPQFGARNKGERMEQLKKSAHFIKGKFQNPVTTNMGGSYKKKLSATLEFAKGGKGHKPAGELPIETRQAADFTADPKQTAITWLGHSAVVIEIDGLRILADPMMGNRASPFSFMGPKRFSKKMPIRPEDLPDFDAVIISHDHYDHLDYSTILKIRDKGKQFLVSMGVGAHLIRWGVAAEKITELDWNTSASIASVKFTATPARHFSGRMGFDAFKTFWSSWVIEGSQQKIFFGADSGYFEGFKTIGEQHGPFDLVMLECGAYNPAWKNIHMFPEETAQAATDLKAKVLLPIHWGVFSLAPQPWTEPIERLSKAAAKHDFILTTPKIGQRLLPESKFPNDRWWEGY